MKFAISANRRVILAATAVVLLGAGMAWSVEPPPAASASPAAPSKETREKMAQLHEQMAACLRSDKSIDACRSEMMKNCHDLGEQGCPMMGHGGMRKMRPHSDSPK